jgi:hypothetical protein
MEFLKDFWLFVRERKAILANTTIYYPAATWVIDRIHDRLSIGPVYLFYFLKT